MNAGNAQTAFGNSPGLVVKVRWNGLPARGGTDRLASDRPVGLEPEEVAHRQGRWPAIAMLTDLATGDRIRDGIRCPVSLRVAPVDAGGHSMRNRHAWIGAAVGFLLGRGGHGQAPATPDVEAILVRARDAAARGDQRAVLECGVGLRAAAPSDPRGHFLIGVAAGSLGPSFARDTARQAFARLAALLAAAPAAALRDLPALPRRATASALRESIADWQAELAAGRKLLLVPDRGELARLVAGLRDRAARLEGWVVAERGRLERARAQRAEAERALRRERTRKRRPGETLVDLQPIVDRIATSERAIQVSARRIREHEARLAEVEADAKRAAARLAELE